MHEPGTATREAFTAPVTHMSASLDGTGACIAHARRLAAGFLADVHAAGVRSVAPSAVDLVQLVLSELVTNAVKYAPGPIVMELRIVGEQVEVVVRDCDPVLPAARAAEAGRVGGHGLEIVVRIADSFEARREPVGKRITARLSLGGTA
ncbi:ATP-binding protein [Streptomyces omiyaensis]|uniref:ATP-binding protein n=2 Tax=Streptomyces omiyaensis TaxID=68247 RepID=A0ABW7C0X1_9ACTN